MYNKTSCKLLYMYTYFFVLAAQHASAWHIANMSRPQHRGAPPLITTIPYKRNKSNIKNIKETKTEHMCTAYKRPLWCAVSCPIPCPKTHAYKHAHTEQPTKRNCSHKAQSPSLWCCVAAPTTVPPFDSI